MLGRALLRGFIWLGAASYPVYVMHVPLLILFERYTHQAGLTQSALIAPLLAPAFLIGLLCWQSRSIAGTTSRCGAG